MPSRTSALFLAAVMICLASCKPSVDLSTDVARGWDGHTWGTPREKLIEKFKLQKADMVTVGALTAVTTGQIRTLGGAAVSVQYLFTSDAFVGVTLTNRPNAEVDVARTALTEWFGKPAGDDLWRKNPVQAQLKSYEDGDFLITILNRDLIMPGVKKEVEKTGELFKEADAIKKNTKPDGPNPDK